ncbi:MAG: acyl-CoA thioesterase II [Corynebacterium sp.]|nr:acyl-CoA thioesterase II [Corynebacterium sp.]
MPKIAALLDIEQLDSYIFRGPVIPTTFTRTFGGQVASQTLAAAICTVNPTHGVHSLHGYFVGPGDATKHTIFMVEPIREGGSFISRHITAIQDGAPIFSMHCSFHRRTDTGIEHSDDMRAVPPPEAIEVNVDALPPSSRALLAEWTDWDIRQVPPEQYEHNRYTYGQQLVWFKTKTRLPDDETLHLCTLTYMSDMTLLHTALVPHKNHPVQLASLDHAIWFLRPFRADEWLLYDQISPSAHAGRALTHGRVFNQAGDLVAIVTQEGLTRDLKEGKRALPLKNLESGQQ